jgi:hypothetical protein
MHPTREQILRVILGSESDGDLMFCEKGTTMYSGPKPKNVVELK